MLKLFKKAKNNDISQQEVIEEVEETPKEMMNVGVEGTYSFEVIEREIYTMVNSFFLYHQKKYFIEFRYSVNISFLDKNFDSKGKIRVEPFEDDTEKMFFAQVIIAKKKRYIYT